MGQQETPPSSPRMDEYIEEIDGDEFLEGDVEILDSYQVVEDEVDEEDEEKSGVEMSEAEIVQVMEREDSCCTFEQHTSEGQLHFVEK